jgi:hypothetical protein
MYAQYVLQILKFSQQNIYIKNCREIPFLNSIFRYFITYFKKNLDKNKRDFQTDEKHKIIRKLRESSKQNENIASKSAQSKNEFRATLFQWSPPSVGYRLYGVCLLIHMYVLYDQSNSHLAAL